jgi:hypothetical protein
MRKARVRPTGGAFDVECRDGGVLVAYIGCPTRVLAGEVAKAFVSKGYSAAQTFKAKALAAKEQIAQRPAVTYTREQVEAAVREALHHVSDLKLADFYNSLVDERIYGCSPGMFYVAEPDASEK